MKSASMFLASLLCLVGSALATPLDAVIEAHGGRAKFDSFGTVSYTLDMKFNGSDVRDVQTFDLKNRFGLIVGEGYSIGYDGTDVWMTPAETKLPFPPRFYLWTPMYFFLLPHVLADPGTIHESLGQREFDGKTYDVVKVSYKPGTGDAPDDYYIVYSDPQTHQAKLFIYIVTYFSKDPPPTGYRQSVMVVDSWQTVSGLTLPHVASFYLWKDGEPLSVEDRKGIMAFNDVKFAVDRPAASMFARPDGAAVAPAPAK